jgi:hypothetical protein
VHDIPEGGILAVDSSVDEARYVGVRSVVANGQVFVTVEFVVDTEHEMWAQIERVLKEPECCFTCYANAGNSRARRTLPAVTN